MKITRIPPERRLPERRSGWISGPHRVLRYHYKYILMIGWWKIEWGNADKDLARDPMLWQSLREMAQGKGTIVRGGDDSERS